MVLLIGFTIHLSVVLFVFNLFSDIYLKKSINNHIAQTQREVGLGIELMVYDIQMLSLRFLVNSDIYKIIGNDAIANSIKKEQIRDVMKQMIAQNEMVGDVVIVTTKGETYRYQPDNVLIEQPDSLLLHRIAESSKPVVGPIKRDANHNAYVTFGQKFRNFNTGQNLGAIIVYIKESTLLHLYQSSFEGLGYSFLVSDQNVVISHPDQSRIGSTVSQTDVIYPDREAGYRTVKVDNHSYFMITYPLNKKLEIFDVNWRFVSVLSSRQLFIAIDEGNRYALLFAGLTFLFLLILSYYLAKKITNPVTRLKTKLNLLGKTGLKGLSGPPVKGDEISELERSYYRMVERINQLLEENNEEKEKQRKMELTALQSQINPHFLYNTLDAIVWIARLKKQPEIERLISSLATFFRISLHKGDKFIPVEEEIRLVQSFVTVEQMRFPDKFEIEYEIPEALRKIRLLKLILQPLVENAIKHGISEKRGKGHIHVKGELTEEEIIFSVSDDGVGFQHDRETLLQKSQVLFQSGYGLRNVEERIKLEYGPNYGLTIQSEIGKGTTVYLRINKKP
ncbi:sensor histidine kinase [Paenibacillus baekrokdamisoli]|nr:histidine kinase [Paenibacillus baekrokdamisoli]